MRSAPALAAAALLALGTGCAAQSPPDLPGWRPVWSDEFDGPAIDPEKWRIEYAALVKNNELQFYTEDEAYIEDGCLVLRSRRRPFGGRDFTSALVDTQHRFAQAFGRFEVRAKLPKGRGIWPAHWMLPEDHPVWPPEIDLMELLGHEPDTVHLTQHWGAWPNNAHDGVAFKGPDFSEDFHTFAIEWTPDRIDWFVDGVLRFSRTEEIPQIPFYMILNTAVGGDWPGNPDATTRFPQFHRIDYVRVWALDDPSRPTLTLNTPRGSALVEPARYAFAPGEKVTIRARPDFGYVFAGWTDESDREIDSPETTLTMDRPRVLTARFVPDPELPPRIGIGAAAVASSSESEHLGPALAIDGYPGTRWSSAFSDPQSLTIDLGSPASIRTLRILWENARPQRYTLSTSLDGIAWTPAHTGDQPDPGPDVVPLHDARARYLRIDAPLRATQWGISIWEVEIYGVPLPD